jgi:hypothetical protein
MLQSARHRPQHDQLHQDLPCESLTSTLGHLQIGSLRYRLQMGKPEIK